MSIISYIDFMLIFFILSCQTKSLTMDLGPEPPNSSIESHTDLDTGGVLDEDSGIEPPADTAAQTDSESENIRDLGLIWVEPGSFDMGSPDNEWGRKDDETQHFVTLTHGFFLGRTEVTRTLFESVMGYSPSSNDGCDGDCPAALISWHESAAFMNLLSEEEGLDTCFECAGSGDMIECQLKTEDPYSCSGYRFPTEAEWEYAARAGEDYRFSGSSNPKQVAWYMDNANSNPMPVAQKNANAWGFVDMTGNLFEWCWDLLAPYPEGDAIDPVSLDGDFRIFRGGGWFSGDLIIRVAARFRYGPDYRASDVGLRIARNGD